MKNNKLTVLFICHDNGNGGAALSLYNLVRAVSKGVVPIVLARQEGILTKNLTDIGVEVLIYPFELNIANENKVFRFFTYIARRFRDYFVNSRCIEYVHSQLNNRVIDIVHTNSSVISFGGKMARTFKAKHVWHIREYMDLDFNMTPIEGLTEWQSELFSADALIAITKSIYDYRKMYLHKNAYIIPDAVRPLSEITHEHHKSKYVLFCASNLSDGKGADQAAEIFCRSDLYEKGYQLFYIGNYTPKYKTKLESIAYDAGKENALMFLGRQKDIRTYMMRASAFLMCSRFEGLGRVTIEAMFYGCPVLGRNTGGTTYIIKDGQNGLLYDNVDEAVIKLNSLIENNSLSNQLVINAAEDARNNFSEEVYGEKIIKVYQNIIG